MEIVRPAERLLLRIAGVGVIVLTCGSCSWASDPRVLVVPAHMRHATVAQGAVPVPIGGGLRDSIEVAITEVLVRALQDAGGTTVVTYEELPKLGSEWDKQQLGNYVNLGVGRTDAFVMSPQLRAAAASACDLIVVPQFSLTRIDTTGRSRISDITARYIYVGQGQHFEGVNYQQFSLTAKVRFPKEFPLETEIPELVFSSFARTVAASAVPYFEEGQRIAMDGLMDELRSALDIGQAPAIQEATDAIATLTSVRIDDPQEAYMLGRAYAARGDAKQAVSWLQLAQDGGLDPLQDVAAALGRAQAATGDYPAAMVSLERAFGLARRKKLATDGLLREILDAAKAGGLAGKEAEYLEMVANPLTYGAASDEERANALLKAATLYAGLGQNELAPAILSKLASAIVDGAYRLDSAVRDRLLLEVRASLKGLTRETEATGLTNLLYAEAVTEMRNGSVAVGLAKLEPIMGDTGARGLFWQAYALSKLGEVRESKVAYKKALELQPTLLEAAYNLRLQYLAEANADEIYRLYTSMHLAMPSDAHISYGLALAMMAKGEFEQSLAILTATPADEHWKVKYERAVTEIGLLKTRQALAVDDSLTLEGAVAGGVMYTNKTVDWRGTVQATREGKTFIDVDVSVPGGPSFVARFFNQKPIIPNGSPVRMVGRIIRYVETPPGARALSAAMVPLLATIAFGPQDALDGIGAPAGVSGEMLIP